MCGIAGTVTFDRGAPDKGTLTAMADSIAHRGPDASGISVRGACGLAHRRLSIIDLEGSKQPMRAGSFDLVYNGELYNYRELRRQLVAAGVSLETAGDTEVVLQLVRAKGAGCLGELDGMFAFAVWDETQERLLLARDPIGIKPLFYACPTPGTIVFGSEIKALLQHPLVERSLDLDGLRQVLRFRAVYGTRTLYRGVRQLEPGCFLEFDRAGLREGRYYDAANEFSRARTEYAGLSESELVARGREHLEEAVRKRLIADVPVGAFLSGGLDSSLIVALIKASRPAEAETCTFSVGFEDDSDSELPYAATVARHLGTRHTEVAVRQSDYLSDLAQLTGVRDAPVSEPADVAIARMSRIAREQVKVVLSGEGADEVFCGYPKYGFARTPGVVRAGLRVLGPSGAERLGRVFGLDARRVRVAANSLTPRTELDRLVQWFSYLDRTALRDHFPGLGWSDEEWQETTASQDRALLRFSGGDAVVRMQGVDLHTWLPGNLLERGDRMTMSAGLEARVPFLDKKVVAFGLALDTKLKIRKRTLKWIVREWAREALPSEIVGRRKWGFRVPLESWFRGTLRDPLRDYLTRPGGVCDAFGDKTRIQGLLDAHDAGTTDANLALWTILATEIWYQEVFEARDAALAT